MYTTLSFKYYTVQLVKSDLDLPIYGLNKSLEQITLPATELVTEWFCPILQVRNFLNRSKAAVISKAVTDDTVEFVIRVRNGTYETDASANIYSYETFRDMKKVLEIMGYSIRAYTMKEKDWSNYLILRPLLSLALLGSNDLTVLNRLYPPCVPEILRSEDIQMTEVLLFVNGMIREDSIKPMLSSSIERFFFIDYCQRWYTTEARNRFLRCILKFVNNHECLLIYHESCTECMLPHYHIILKWSVYRDLGSFEHQMKKRYAATFDRKSGIDIFESFDRLLSVERGRILNSNSEELVRAFVNYLETRSVNITLPDDISLEEYQRVEQKLFYLKNGLLP